MHCMVTGTDDCGTIGLGLGLGLGRGLGVRVCTTVRPIVDC